MEQASKSVSDIPPSLPSKIYAPAFKTKMSTFPQAFNVSSNNTFPPSIVPASAFTAIAFPFPFWLSIDFTTWSAADAFET